jgi:predicted transposase/invertase (TIGR01784 family)
MKSFFSISQFLFKRELKKHVVENVEQGKPLKVIDDIVFKAMLGSDTEDSNEALRSFLSACTHREIRSVRLANNDLIPAHLEAKSSRLDVHAIFNDGESADLEMQMDKSNDDLKARAEQYASLLVSGQSEKGKQYKGIKRVYQIFFLNCVLFPKSNKLPRRYSYREETEHDRLNDLTEIIFYEMPKLKWRVRDYLEGKIDAESLSEEEKWCMYMGYRHDEQAVRLIDDLCQKEKGIMHAEKTVNGISRDYRKFARKMAITKNRIDREYAELRAEEAQAKAKAEGRTEGHNEKALEIARKMKAIGRPEPEIAEVTGLTVDEVIRC